jgi:hypothetical protein
VRLEVGGLLLHRTLLPVQAPGAYQGGAETLRWIEGSYGWSRSATVTRDDHLYTGRESSPRRTTASPRRRCHVSNAGADAQALRTLQSHREIEPQRRLASGADTPGTEGVSIAIDPATAHPQCARHILDADEAVRPWAELLSDPISDRLDVVVVEDHVSPPEVGLADRSQPRATLACLALTAPREAQKVDVSWPGCSE